MIITKWTNIWSSYCGIIFIHGDQSLVYQNVAGLLGGISWLTDLIVNVCSLCYNVRHTSLLLLFVHGDVNSLVWVTNVGSLWTIMIPQYSTSILIFTITNYLLLYTLLKRFMFCYISVLLVATFYKYWLHERVTWEIVTPRKPMSTEAKLRLTLVLRGDNLLCYPLVHSIIIILYWMLI